VNKTTESPPADRDKFVFWPLLLAVGGLFIVVLLGTYPEYGDHARAAQIGVIFSDLILILIGFFCFLVAAYAASVRRWRQAASVAVLPAAIVIAVMYPLLILGPFGTLSYIYRLAGFHETEIPY
jgi:uncharacterized membrane protein YhaH (DUF805 family)